MEPIVKDGVNRSGKLILKCKNFMICIFEINNLDDCLAVARSIEKLSNLSKFLFLFFPLLFIIVLLIITNYLLLLIIQSIIIIYCYF